MKDRTKKIIGAISIIFIVGLYAYKGLPSFVGQGIGEALPMIVTSLAVTGLKVGIIYGAIVAGKKIVNKVNHKKKEVNESNFEKQKDDVKIIEREKEVKKTNTYTNNIQYEEGIVKDKPKILIKKK